MGSTINRNGSRRARSATSTWVSGMACCSGWNTPWRCKSGGGFYTTYKLLSLLILTSLLETTLLLARWGDAEDESGRGNGSSDGDTFVLLVIFWIMLLSLLPVITLVFCCWCSSSWWRLVEVGGGNAEKPNKLSKCLVFVDADGENETFPDSLNYVFIQLAFLSFFVVAVVVVSVSCTKNTPSIKLSITLRTLAEADDGLDMVIFCTLNVNCVALSLLNTPTSQWSWNVRNVTHYTSLKSNRALANGRLKFNRNHWYDAGSVSASETVVIVSMTFA